MNRLSVGTNNIGETSTYVYNGLGYLVQNVWEIKKNAYGYQEIQPTAVVTGEVVVDTATGKKDSKEKKSAEVVLADPELNKTTTVVKDFVLDYTRNLQDVLYETESGNLNYRYGYGLQKLSATISPIDSGAGAIVENGAVKLYYHQDYLGTTDYLTSDATGKVVSWTMYNEWGEITHNAVLKCGIRELDLVKNYTGYEFDPVLGQYYAKNRMYDAENRRFTQIDPAMDGDNWYAYVGNNPVNCVDLLGLAYIVRERTMVRDTSRRGMPVYEYTGYYNLEPEDSASVWQKIALTPVPWGGTLGSLSEKNNGIVGGTSASNLVQSVGIDSVQQADMIESKVTYRMYYILLFLAAIYICILQDKIPMIFMFYIIDGCYDTEVYTDIFFYLLFSSLVFFLYFQAHFPPKNEFKSKKNFIKKKLYLVMHVVIMVAAVYVVFTVIITRFYVNASIHYITIDVIEKYHFMPYVIAVINDLVYGTILILSYHIIGSGTIVIVNSSERIKYTRIINRISRPLAFFYLKILAFSVFAQQIIVVFFIYVWKVQEKHYSVLMNSFGEFFFRYISYFIDAVCIVLIFQTLIRYSYKDNGAEVKNFEKETTKLPDDLS